MTPVTDADRKMLDSIARSRPDLRDFIVAWRRDELERMAVSSETQFGANKGRVAVLTELQHFLSLPKP